MPELIKEVVVADDTYVVQAVDAQTQYKILQKLSRYGLSTLIAGLVMAESKQAKVEEAFIKALLALVERMPEVDQDFCLSESLKKTARQGESEPVSISLFTGRISEYVLLGVRAIGVQLGDFSCFQSLIKEFTAKAPEGNE